MPGFVSRNVVVIGVSAGGVETLGRLIKRLPRRFPAILFVAMHFPRNGISVLPQILNRLETLPAKHPQDGESVNLGQIYVAPPGQHLLVQNDQIKLSQGPKENGQRPSIDGIFRSVAYAYKKRVIGIILSGTLDDGTAGLALVKALGGVAIAQDPEEALYDGMPRSAIRKVDVDYVLPIEEIAARLQQLVNQPIGREAMMASDQPMEDEILAKDKAQRELGDHPGTPSPLTCPDCGGVLWELQQGDLLRYRCHVGHTYSADGLIAGQAEDVERALWSAVRALEERAALARRMAAQARGAARFKSEKQFMERAEEAEQNATIVRQVMLQSILTQTQEDLQREKVGEE